MRLTPQWSLYNRRLAAAAAPPPAFDPATLFGAGEKGIVIDLHTATMINGTFNPVVVGEGVERLYPQVYNYSTSLAFRQTTTSARPVLQQSGAVRWLSFDGTNDWMSTIAGTGFNNIDTGGSDAVTLIAGLRRGQSANMEDVFGLSSNPPGTAGTYRLCPTFDAASDNAAFASRGDGSDAGARAGSTLVSTDYVLTGVGDISSDTTVVRRNGVQLGSSATDQGAGTYQNNVAYLGSRGGTSRFFNGRLYAILMINRVLTAVELSNAEAWVASKCGITI